MVKNEKFDSAKQAIANPFMMKMVSGARNLFANTKTKAAQLLAGAQYILKNIGNSLTKFKNKYALKVAMGSLIFAPVVGTIACDKEPTPLPPSPPVIPCTDYTNPECENYDSCWQAKQDYDIANDNYLDARRQCLQVYLPQCFTYIQGFKGNYDMYLPRDDSLLTVQTVVNGYLDEAPQYLVGHEALADSAKQTSIRTLNLKEVLDSVYNANQSCL